MNTGEELTEKQLRYVRLLEEKGRELNRRWTTVQTYRGHLIRYMRWLDRNQARVRYWPSEKKVAMYLKKLSVRDRVGFVTRKQAFYALRGKRFVLRDPSGRRSVRSAAVASGSRNL